jgi:cell wall-associated NlpC family hydrolase
MKKLAVFLALTVALCIFSVTLSGCGESTETLNGEPVGVPSAPGQITPPKTPEQTKTMVEEIGYDDVLRIWLASALGIPYIYGGDNAVEGYDCSGFVMEYLKMFGMAPPQDSSSDMMYDYLLNKPADRVSHYKPGIGALVFYGKKSADGKAITRISHIALMINNDQIAEAGGGDQSTLSEKEAASRNAFVRIRPYKYRKDMLIAVMPKYPAWVKHPGTTRPGTKRNCPKGAVCMDDSALDLPWYF